MLMWHIRNVKTFYRDDRAGIKEARAQRPCNELSLAFTWVVSPVLRPVWSAFPSIMLTFVLYSPLCWRCTLLQLCDTIFLFTSSIKAPSVVKVEKGERCVSECVCVGGCLHSPVDLLHGLLVSVALGCRANVKAPSSSPLLNSFYGSCHSMSPASFLPELHFITSNQIQAWQIATVRYAKRWGAEFCTHLGHWLWEKRSSC